MKLQLYLYRERYIKKCEVFICTECELASTFFSPYFFHQHTLVQHPIRSLRPRVCTQKNYILGRKNGGTVDTEKQMRTITEQNTDRTNNATCTTGIHIGRYQKNASGNNLDSRSRQRKAAKWIMTLSIRAHRCNKTSAQFRRGHPARIRFAKDAIPCFRHSGVNKIADRSRYGKEETHD